MCFYHMAPAIRFASIVLTHNNPTKEAYDYYIYQYTQGNCSPVIWYNLPNS